MWQLLDEIRVLLAHILRIPTEDADSAVLQPVHLPRPQSTHVTPHRETRAHLCALTIVLILACKPLGLEPVEDLADGLRRLREHGLERHAGRKLASRAKTIDARLEQRGDDKVVRRQLTIDRLDDVGGLLEPRG